MSKRGRKSLRQPMFRKNLQKIDLPVLVGLGDR